MNKLMLMVVAEARVQHASLKTDFAPLLKMTRLFPRVQQPKQYVLPEMTTRPRETYLYMFPTYGSSNTTSPKTLHAYIISSTCILTLVVLYLQPIKLGT
uniref:Uncharacterized protein n=1 Tax=Helianthus annuus TaxID=4232 RepID=A0A251SIA5_HELAN